jgi:hypothetical protein
MVAVLGGCAASPVTTPGYVSFAPAERGQVELGGDARVTGVAGLGWSAGGTLRVAPQLRPRWSLPLEAGAYPTFDPSGRVIAITRVGFRHLLHPWVTLGAGLSGNYVHADGNRFGGGVDFEAAFGKTWRRVGLSGTVRPGFAYNAVALPTLWLPGEVAVAYRPTERVSLFVSAFVASGLTVSAFGAFAANAAGGAVGLSVRLGRASTKAAAPAPRPEPPPEPTPKPPADPELQPLDG